MRELEVYVDTGDRQALERFCQDRAAMQALVRRFKIDCYEIDDLVQEGFLAALTWAEDVRAMRPVAQDNAEAAVFAHLRRIKKSGERHNPPRKMLNLPAGVQADDIPDDDIRARTQGDYDALALLIAAQSECDKKDRELLDLLIGGEGLRSMCPILRANKSAVRQRVCRFRARLLAKLFPEEVYETDRR